MADRNVQAFLRREAEIGQAQAHVRNLSEATHQALWADTQAKRGNTQAEKARQDKRGAGEMEQASREVKARRSERRCGGAGNCLNKHNRGSCRTHDPLAARRLVFTWPCGAYARSRCVSAAALLSGALAVCCAGAARSCCVFHEHLPAAE